MTRIIGITGGIGSGKSTLASCFANMGIPVFDADAISREALSPNSACFAKAVSLFGDKALRADGTADRAYIAACVFRDPDLMDQLNAVIHPYVIETLIAETEACVEPLAVWDVPLLFESGCDAFCACTIAVLCSEELRIERVMRRDGLDEEQVRARIARQTTDEYRAACATYTILNEKDEEAFVRHAEDLIVQIRKELQ